MIIENTSADTFSSAGAVTARVNPRARVALVTSAWHVRRSPLSFEASGLLVLPASADFLGQGRLTIALGSDCRRSLEDPPDAAGVSGARPRQVEGAPAMTPGCRLSSTIRLPWRLAQGEHGPRFRMMPGERS